MPDDTKRCFKCGETKPLEDFYRHPEMACGRLGKCKACTRKDVSEQYRATLPARRAYERQRAQNPERKRRAAEYLRRSRQRSPEKHAARKAVADALRSGELVRGPCERCGNPHSQAHHGDYSKPLDVRWLCFRCHRTYGHDQVTAETTP